MKPIIMGVLNVTPDSFFDGNKYLNFEDCKKQIDKMINDGVDIIDVGGESTRPNAKKISTEEELNRVIPVIEYIKNNYKVKVSLDSSNPVVMSEAIKLKIDMLNDVRSFTIGNALEIAVKSNLPICLMHMKGSPENMQNNPEYINVIEEIKSYLKERIKSCLDVGIKRENIIVDPGFGFGKTLEHNVLILKNLKEFSDLGFDVLVGLSRKSMIGHITQAKVEDRLAGSIALNILAYQNGAKIFRVHDVFETKQAFDVINHCA